MKESTPNNGELNLKFEGYKRFEKPQRKELAELIFAANLSHQEEFASARRGSDKALTHRYDTADINSDIRIKHCREVAEKAAKSIGFELTEDNFRIIIERSGLVYDKVPNAVVEISNFKE